jgi:hypothetical protein
LRTETEARATPVARALRGTAALALALAGAGGLLVATRSLAPARAAVLILELEAIAAALVGPLLAARVLEDEEHHRDRRALAARGLASVGQLAVFAAAIAIGMAARGGADLAAALLAQVVLVLEAIGLGALTLAVGSRRGPAPGLVLGLGAGALVLGFPYFAGNLVAALPRGAEEQVVSWIVVLCPAIATTGTFAGSDVFRSSELYDAFRPVQDVGCQYASPLQALAVPAVAVAILVLLAWLARRPRLAVAAVALVLVLGAPSGAEAQDIFGSSSTSASGSTDDSMQFKVRLGYLVPFLEGNFKVSGGTPGILPTRLDLNSDLDLKLAYAIPTFEVELAWPNTARIWADYWEATWIGNFLSPGYDPTTFKNIMIPAYEVGTVNYNFRTIGAHAALEIPIVDFITLELIGTVRYVHYGTRLEAPRSGIRDRDNVDAYSPGIGAGADMFVTDMVYIYANVQWLDVSFGFIKGPALQYREVHAGARLEIVSHAMIGVEFYWLEVNVSSATDDYRQRMIGPRVWVGVEF